MKKICVLVLVYLAWTAGMSGCVSQTDVPSSPNPGQPEDQPTPPASAQLSDLIEQIRQSPQDYLGETVEITGYFRGWDLLAEVGGPPPVTRSDWVIADEGGALYVTGRLPANLNPASRDDTGTVIRLTATVAMSQEQVYLEAQSVDVLPEH
jgi:hypothetical protein